MYSWVLAALLLSGGTVSAGERVNRPGPDKNAVLFALCDSEMPVPAVMCRSYLEGFAEAYFWGNPKRCYKPDNSWERLRNLYLATLRGTPRQYGLYGADGASGPLLLALIMEFLTQSC